jgi:hypothetical protein
MSDPIEEFEVGELTVKIYQDDCHDDSPRDWDNAGTMVCWHGRYNLGDEQPREDASDYLMGLLPDEVADGLNELFEKDWEDYYNHEFVTEDSRKKANREVQQKHQDLRDTELEKVVFLLPLYLMDHSGISISTSSAMFRACDSAGWDWGQVGFIYMTKEKARSEWTGTEQEIAEKAEACMRQEVETYNQYLTGDVYYYLIEDEEGTMHDSCGGMYGFDYTVKEAKEIAEGIWETLKTESYLI